MPKKDYTTYKKVRSSLLSTVAARPDVLVEYTPREIIEWYIIRARQEGRHMTADTAGTFSRQLIKDLEQLQTKRSPMH